MFTRLVTGYTHGITPRYVTHVGLHYIYIQYALVTTFDCTVGLRWIVPLRGSGCTYTHFLVGWLFLPVGGCAIVAQHRLCPYGRLPQHAYTVATVVDSDYVALPASRLRCPVVDLHDFTIPVCTLVVPVDIPVTPFTVVVYEPMIYVAASAPF